MIQLAKELTHGLIFDNSNVASKAREAKRHRGKMVNAAALTWSGRV
jgi:hypothetical protein